MKKYIKEFSVIFIGAFFVALGLNMFLVPFKLSSGGIGTIGVVLLYFFKIPLSVTNLVFNIVLFALGLKFLKKRTIAKTVFGIFALSLFLQITSYFPQMKEDIFLSMVLGGVFDGIGMGLVLSVDGSTGGIDFLALMVKKRLARLSIADFIFIANVVMFAISGIVFKSYSVTFYSSISMFVSAKVTDFVMNMGFRAKSVMIITKKPDEIEKLIFEEFGRRVTEIYSKGAMTDEDMKTLVCVVKPREALKIVKKAREFDEKAFLFTFDINEVFGKGFPVSQE